MTALPPPRRRRKGRVRDSEGMDIPSSHVSSSAVGGAAASSNRDDCVLIALLYIELLGGTSCSSSPTGRNRSRSKKRGAIIRERLLRRCKGWVDLPYVPKIQALVDQPIPKSNLDFRFSGHSRLHRKKHHLILEATPLLLEGFCCECFNLILH